ncbi:MAG: ParA family protein [Phycisphaerae bacterium]|nr:ParA family protein [Phycisphaerae bacterium]
MEDVTNGAGKRAQIIAVGNQKGGVGKTTNTVHIAAALGERGRKCLIIDLDPNDTATRHLGMEGEAYLGSYELLTGDEPADVLAITEADEGFEFPKGVHLITSRRKLETIDDVLPEKHGKFFSVRDILFDPLKTVLNRYDYILLDTAPNSKIPTKAAYLVADWFILTAMPEPFAVTGLTDALRDIQDAQKKLNPNLRLLGVIIAGVDRRTNLSNSLTEYVQTAFTTPDGESAKFRTIISRSTVIPSAQKSGKTVFQTHPDHAVTDQYRALATEIEERIARLTANATNPNTEAVIGEVANG